MQIVRVQRALKGKRSKLPARRKHLTLQIKAHYESKSVAALPLHKLL